MNGQLTPSRETDLYRFEAVAGERFYFDAQRATGNTDAIYWRLVDPYGKVVFDRTSFNSDVGLLTLEADGLYTLFIEGRVGSTGTASYRFMAQRIADDVRPLVFGEAQGIDNRQWTQGQLNGALYLDGGMYGEVAGNSALDLIRDMTLEAWVKVDRFADSGQTPVLFRGTSWAGERAYALWVHSDGSVQYSMGDRFGNNYAIQTAAGLVAVDEWHHLAAVLNRTTGQARVYVDGVERAFQSVSQNDGRNHSTALQIGRCLETTNNAVTGMPSFGNFEGTLDEVRIWNVVRSATQIATSMNAELTGAQTGLVAYLKANEGSGTQLSDAQGTHHAQVRNVYGPGSA
ncbi:MAG: LamG domain-containing protein, partial [bacterium]